MSGQALAAGPEQRQNSRLAPCGSLISVPIATIWTDSSPRLLKSGVLFIAVDDLCPELFWFLVESGRIQVTSSWLLP